MNTRMAHATWLWALALSYMVGCGGKHNVGSASEGGSENKAGASGKEGGAGGSAGSAPTSPLEPTTDPANCPSAQPGDGETCSIELASCAYFSIEREYQECMCVEWGANDLRWYCDPKGTQRLSCPQEMPDSGSDCSGHYETRCSFPVGNTCACDVPPTSWQCVGPRLPNFPAAPSSPDPATAIDQLDAEGRAQYCEWYSILPYGPGSPLEDQEVGADGKAGGACASGFEPACYGLVVMLSAKQCAQNLALSTCSAPLAQLTDCVTTMYSRCMLSPNGCACLPAPHGCARFFETPGCSGTLVISKGMFPSETPVNSCLLQVE